MENKSYKMLELFAGTEALNHTLVDTLKVNVKYQETMKNFNQSLKVIYTPEVLVMNKKMKDVIELNTSFVAPEITQRISEMIKKLIFKCPICPIFLNYI